MVSFSEKMAGYTKFADNVIRQYLPEETGEAKHLMEAMNYSMLSGGKRLRPVLMLLACRMFGGDEREVYPFMAAIEMIHTHSLVFDDLPALDNDDYRRGKKTTHVVFGESGAILAGDGLLNLAAETILDAVMAKDAVKDGAADAVKAAAADVMKAAAGNAVKAAAADAINGAVGDAERMMRRVRAGSILMHKAGIHGMIGGQSVDVEMEGKPLNREQLDFIYRLKTGALLEAPLMIGALLAGASKEQIDRMEQIGSLIGMAFQIRDDILDLTGDEKKLGKPLLSDQKNAKTTLVSLFGLKAANREVAAMTEKALGLLVKSDQEARRQCRQESGLHPAQGSGQASGGEKAQGGCIRRRHPEEKKRRYPRRRLRTCGNCCWGLCRGSINRGAAWRSVFRKGTYVIAPGREATDRV